MINRIAHLIPTVDMDQQKPERKLKLVTDSELDRILKAKDNRGNVNMLHPLELFLNKTYLEDVVRTSLAALYDRDASKETEEQLRAVKAAIQQRIDFLSWLTGQPEQVYLAIYPAEDDGLDDLEDLTDLLNEGDDDTPLPF